MTSIDVTVPEDAGLDMEAEPPSIEAPVGHPMLPGIVTALKSVFDPEIPVNIYELGLIYAVEIADSGDVKVEMTLTAPACPSAQELPEMVRSAVAGIEGVGNVIVDTVWDPPWDPSRLSEDARLSLNMF
jgi:FeS assembly SUF system protein